MTKEDWGNLHWFTLYMIGWSLQLLHWVGCFFIGNVAGIMVWQNVPRTFFGGVIVLGILVWYVSVCYVSHQQLVFSWNKLLFPPKKGE